ncbi:MAG: glycosyl transferase [Methylibium sp. NZG]|nr:MAG: glycosyl transferase [Methylibium sp. NZG]
MSISKYIREIGRGKDGARSLSAEQAQDLMTQVLDGRVTDLEVGAFALAMRIKGETPGELAGFLAATQAHCLAPRPHASACPAVWLPSYNGARKLANLTPLLALLLAREGAPVLVHGPLSEPGRVSTAEIFQALGRPHVDSAAAIELAWQRGEPAFVPTEVLCPPLARLLAVRRVVGLRNSGHTVAKVLHPAAGAGNAAGHATCPATFRVVNHTHPEYAGLLTRFLTETGANAMLLRGTEGEPVADARRTPRMDVFCNGERSETLSVPAREGVLTHLPELPRECDVAATAAYIGAVLQGSLPVPESIALQVSAILRTLDQIGSPTAAPRHVTHDETHA